MHIAFSPQRLCMGRDVDYFISLSLLPLIKISTEMKKRHERYKKYGTEVNIHIETSFNMCFIFDEMTR